MKGILIIEVTTSAPKDLFNKENISLQIGAEGMSWKPEIDQLHFWEIEVSQVEKQALPAGQKAFDYPSGMEMNMGMGMGGDF
jgi:hypothetical protein